MNESRCLLGAECYLWHSPTIILMRIFIHIAPLTATASAFTTLTDLCRTHDIGIAAARKGLSASNHYVSRSKGAIQVVTLHRSNLKAKAAKGRF